ncbi:hypothetical protein HERIO_711 [Hepatospora eriocheir]|uniref:Cullin family profile domain-containing protein n=1 Tax=Hepatospora eriocheir TaxID=1081669 RepID=A0A1X0QCA8_9MICR|nr:hypothetical protein HERIO_711 [Hepatospora eriocheir]
MDFELSNFINNDLRLIYSGDKNLTLHETMNIINIVYKRESNDKYKYINDHNQIYIDIEVTFYKIIEEIEIEYDLDSLLNLFDKCNCFAYKVSSIFYYVNNNYVKYENRVKPDNCLEIDCLFLSILNKRIEHEKVLIVFFTELNNYRLLPSINRYENAVKFEKFINFYKKMLKTTFNDLILDEFYENYLKDIKRHLTYFKKESSDISKLLRTCYIEMNFANHFVNRCLLPRIASYINDKSDLILKYVETRLTNFLSVNYTYFILCNMNDNIKIKFNSLCKKHIINTLNLIKVSNPVSLCTNYFKLYNQIISNNFDNIDLLKKYVREKIKEIKESNLNQIKKFLIEKINDKIIRINNNIECDLNSLYLLYEIIYKEDVGVDLRTMYLYYCQKRLLLGYDPIIESKYEQIIGNNIERDSYLTRSIKSFTNKIKYPTFNLIYCPKLFWTKFIEDTCNRKEDPKLVDFISRRYKLGINLTKVNKDLNKDNIKMTNLIIRNDLSKITFKINNYTIISNVIDFCIINFINDNEVIDLEMISSKLRFDKEFIIDRVNSMINEGFIKFDKMYFITANKDLKLYEPTSSTVKTVDIPYDCSINNEMVLEAKVLKIIKQKKSISLSNLKTLFEGNILLIIEKLKDKDLVKISETDNEIIEYC